MRIAVVGQVARDLVLVVPHVPDAGGSAPVRQRREMLGGKGANIAVSAAQLGASPVLVGVLGDDEVADRLVEQLTADGIDTSALVRRPDTTTGLVVDVVCDGRYRYFEDLPESVLLAPADVSAAADALASADAVVVQLQQPGEAALVAARAARGLVVLDGVPSDRVDELLAAADVLRADHQEAELLTGHPVDGVDAALRAGRELLERGPSVVALEVGGEGNAFVWREGELFLPLDDVEVVDTSGGGDAFVAALTVALVGGADVPEAARRAVTASGKTVDHPGGRPDLAPSPRESNAQAV
ncbi:PfkB family carbohydrate kinase [Saccharothrix coeruleofusca]|uniref:Ribokinase n=1 Tax=Saccharothrix coeruleofusca TaxID=33919 RepID=A0A918ARV8_9PSEU|nr:PfkB family carbohydrate kinase [Saccharothrix coeruleofusca]MBP2335331.1 ribokinase [Saccharothrix coeruleofusca]GGP77174.1 ribokinase [Saccharothrix coeruleofusca]